MILALNLIWLNGCGWQQLGDNQAPVSTVAPDLSKLTAVQDPAPAADNSSSNSGETADNSSQPVAPADPNSIDPQKFEVLINTYGGAVLQTNFGEIEVRFYAAESPVTVNNFLNLAKLGFYNGTKFHRVMADFMIQGGDPNSKDDDWSNDGAGGPPYRFKDEINNQPLVRGSLAMANSGVDTNGSQFFIVTKEATPWLDGLHTNFGFVKSGYDVVEKISSVKTNENAHPTTDVIIEKVTLVK